MKLLNKLTIKNLLLNKKRTIVTIIGIMLSVALVTAVATMYSSMIKSLINYETNEMGYFHVAYFDVPVSDLSKIKNTSGVDKLYLTANIGYAEIDSKNEYKPYVFIKGFTKDALENLSVRLTEGRLPESSDEIVIPTHLKTNGRVTLNVGDTVTLEVGKRMLDDYELTQDNPYQDGEKIVDATSKTYKIVGIIERPANNIEDYSAPGYTFITYMDESSVSNMVDVYVKYTKKGSKEYTKVTSSILEVSEYALNKYYESNITSEDEYNTILDELSKAKYDYTLNNYLIKLENNPLDDSTVGGLGAVVVIVIIIIIVTSVFCIKTSFDISITEKTKQYGMLRSIGATKKQIKKNIFYEATILAFIGIPLGLLFGILASYILVIICNILLKDMLTSGMKIVLSYSWVSFVIAITLGFITIYLSALHSAIRGSKVSPIDSIRNSADLKLNSRKLKCPKFISKLFKTGGEISYKNMKRNNKKYRTTIISIIVSVASFIALSYFISSAFYFIDKEISTSDYNVELSGYNLTDTQIEKLKSTTMLDNINNYTIVNDTNMEITTKKENYTKEYFDYMYSVSDNDEYIEEDGISIYIINDEQFKTYVKSLGLDYDKVKDKGILNDYILLIDTEGKEKTMEKYNYKVSDTITGTLNNKETTIEIAKVTRNQPFGLKNNYDSNGELILSSKYYNSGKNALVIYFDSSNPDKLQDDIDTLLNGETYNLTNMNEQVKMMRNLYTLIAIFLYGFIIVVSLIGVTNIFNTITTNMELRKQEFAMLKSIGMTKKEFNNMIRLESIFIGFKSLIIGIPIGILLSLVIYNILIKDDLEVFKIPFTAIIVSIILVYLLITIIMKYSIKKQNKQNIIETIRNENI